MDFSKDIELKDTVELMLSDDYAKRFEGEYYQTAIRYRKLKSMVDNWDNLDFTPTCTKDMYKIQLQKMYQYLGILEMRASVENITLDTNVKQPVEE